MSLARQTRIALATCLALGSGGALAACANVLGFEQFAPLHGEAGTGVEGGTDATDDAPADSGAEASPCVGDLSANSQHCGTCGHSCGGGSCEMNQCLPVKLADNLFRPQGLVVNATEVFVAEHGMDRIARFGKDAMNTCVIPARCLFTSLATRKPTAMGIDGANVYWANAPAQDQNEIRSCPHAGCKSSAPTLVVDIGATAFSRDDPNDTRLPLELIVRDGQVFWPEYATGAIRSTPVSGGGLVTTYTEDSGDGVVALAIDDARLYFTEDRAAGAIDIKAVRRSAPLTVTPLTSPASRPFGIALTSTGTLYFTVPYQVDIGDGLVQATTTSSDGGLAATIASREVAPGPMLVDDTNVYWLIAGDVLKATGSLVYCPLAGCPADGPIVLAGGQRVPRHLTQDASAIYWTNEGLENDRTDGQLWKIAKPSKP